MKKLLSVSIVALMAISPLVASAAEGDRSASLAKGNVATPSASTNIATTSYVKGAHKNLSDKIDLLIDDTAIATDGNYIDAGKTVSHNLKELDTAVNTLATSNGGKQAQLKNDLNPADNIESTVKTSVAATNASSTHLVTESAVRGAIDGAVAGLDASVSQTAGTDGLALSVTEVDGVITGVSGSIAANTYDAYGAASGAVAALDATESQAAGTDGLALSITQTDGVITAISGSIAANTYDAYGAAASAVADKATKAGVLSTINHSTASVSGTATVYTTWGDETANGQGSVTINSSGTVAAPGTNHNEYYADYAGSGENKTTITDPAVAASI